MLVLIIGEKERKDTGENAGQWSKLTNDPSESVDDTTHHFCLPLGKRSLTSESHQETLVKGEGWALGLAFIAFFARESLFNLLFIVLWVFSQLWQAFAFWEPLHVTPGWRYCCINETDGLAVSFCCFILLFQPHKNRLSSWPLSHFPERETKEGGKRPVPSHKAGGGRAARENTGHRTKGEFHINRSISYCKSIPNMTWDIFTLKTYLLFIWNSDLTGLAVKYIYLLSVATLAGGWIEDSANGCITAALATGGGNSSTPL